MSGKTIVKRSSGAKPTRQTDWAAFDAKTDDEIARDVADDPDAAPLLDRNWFDTARLVPGETKEKISIRLDRDVLDYFRAHGRYQTQINEVLRAYVKHAKAGRR